MASLAERIAAARRAEQENAGGSLAQEIAAARQAEDKQARIEEVRAEEAAALEAFDPTEGMTTFEKTMAGMGQGVANIGRNVGNIVGLVEDEELEEAKALDEDLLDTTAGSVGSFVGEMAALAPLGAVGGATRAAGAVGRVAPRVASKFPRALSSASSAANAALQGAAAGAVTADPNERGAGAVQGAAAGALLNKTLGALGRRVGRGPVSMSDDAKILRNAIEKETGRKIHIPFAQAAGEGGGAASGKFIYRSALPMFPLARRELQKQGKNLVNDWQEAVVRRAYSGKNADEVMKVLKETGDLKKAVEAGSRLTQGAKGNYLRQAREALEETIMDLPAGQQLTPRALDNVVRKYHSGTGAPFADLTEYGARVMGEAIEESTVAGRSVFHHGGDIATTILPFLGGPTSGGAAILGTRLMAGEGRNLVGLTGQGTVQRAIQSMSRGTRIRTDFMLDALRNSTVASIEENQ